MHLVSSERPTTLVLPARVIKHRFSHREMMYAKNTHRTLILTIMMMMMIIMMMTTGMIMMMIVSHTRATMDQVTIVIQAKYVYHSHC